MNGITLHGGYIPYGATFLTFADYSRNALRMAALMRQPRRCSCSRHDSIGLGEDGPTHQSIEHVASLRLIPNMDVWRPADTAETAVAWAECDPTSRERPERPDAVSRQNLPFQRRDDVTRPLSRAAATCCATAPNPRTKRPDAVILATGSEVGLARGRRRAAGCRWRARARGHRCPATTVFDKQDAAYKSQRAAGGRAARGSGGRRQRLLVEVPGPGGGRHRHASANPPRPACCSSTSASRWKTSPIPCAPRSPSNSRPRGSRVRRAGCGAGPAFIDRTLGDRHDHQDRHQRLRPHRAHGVPCRRGQLQGR